MPGANGFHAFSTGVHWTHGRRAVSPIAMFMDMMMNQTMAFIQPLVSRSSVTAKLVLDQMAAVTENVPATLSSTSTLAMSSRLGGMSHVWAPYPSVVA